MYVHYFLEQLKSPLFKFFKKLPIIQKIIHEYLAQAYWGQRGKQPPERGREGIPIMLLFYTFLQVSSYKVDPSHDDDEGRCECLADEECCPRDNGITLKIVSTSMAALM